MYFVHAPLPSKRFSARCNSNHPNDLPVARRHRMKYRSLEPAACPILVGGCGDLKVVYLAFLTYSSAGHQHDLTASLAAAWHSRVEMAGPLTRSTNPGGSRRTLGTICMWEKTEMLRPFFVLSPPRSANLTCPCKHMPSIAPTQTAKANNFANDAAHAGQEAGIIAIIGVAFCLKYHRNHSSQGIEEFRFLGHECLCWCGCWVPKKLMPTSANKSTSLPRSICLHAF